MPSLRVAALVLAGALTGQGRAATAGEPSRLRLVQQTCAAAADEALRPALLERVLTVETGGEAVHVESDGRMVIDFAGSISAEEGHVRLDGGEARAVATVRADAAAALLQARADGKLVARIAFRLAEQEGMERPCTAIGGGDFLRVRATPLWVDLTVGGKSLARALTSEGALEPSAGAVARVVVLPTVEGAVGREAEPVAAVARELEKPGLACYRPAAKAGRTGAIALALDVAATGAVAEVGVPIDGVRDPALARCIVKEARGLRFPRSPKGVRLTATLTFDLTPAN